MLKELRVENGELRMVEKNAKFLKIIFILFCLCVLNNSCSSQYTQTETECFSLCFTGDVLLDRGVREQIEKKGISYLFEDVAPLFQQSDAVIINLECPVTDIVSPINKKYIFRADPIWLPELKKSGITHAALANNHSMDQGRKGLEETNNQLTNNGIQAIGYGRNQEEACRPVFLKKNGIEVAIYNSVTLPLENWVCLDDAPGVCQMSVNDLAENIHLLKKAKPACYIIVVLHWGMEFQQTPTWMQRKDGRHLIDAGADAIIGHHPHVIQPEEIYQGKPIFYSLGNFVFDQRMPETCNGLIIELLFSKDSMQIKKHPVKIENSKPVFNEKI